MRHKRICQVCFLAGLLGLAGIAYLLVQQDNKPTNHAVFEATGHTARDVVNALVKLDQLEVAPADPTSERARQAILKAERSFGLPADGMADQTLLDYLIAEVAKELNQTPSIYAGVEAIHILCGLIASLLSIYGFFFGVRTR